MKNLIYLFIGLFAIGLLFTSCEQDYVTPIAEITEIEVSETSTYFYKGETYELTTIDGVTDVPEELSEVWNTGLKEMLFTKDGQEVHLFDNIEQSDEFYEQLKESNPFGDLEIDMRFAPQAVFYDYPNYGRVLLRYSLGGVRDLLSNNNAISSVYLNNTSNRYYRIYLYDFPQLGGYYGSITVDPNSIVQGYLTGRFNNTISSVWAALL